MTMDNKLQIASLGVLTSQKPSQVGLSQYGDNNTQIAHVDNFDGTSITNVMLVGGQQGTMSTIGGALNKEYYNLFVIGGEIFNQFSNGHFLIDKRRALTEDVSLDIKDSVNTLHPEAREFVKTLPAIFADENMLYGKSDDTQMAFFGFVTEVRIQDNGIKIFYQTLNAIPQKRLNEMIDNLAIRGHKGFNEFDRTHWTIKRINLVEELREAGITVFAP